jgi:hypothetical protein
MKNYEIENKIVEIKIKSFSKNYIVLSVQINVETPMCILMNRKRFFGIDDWFEKNVNQFDDLIKFYKK